MRVSVSLSCIVESERWTKYSSCDTSSWKRIKASRFYSLIPLTVASSSLRTSICFLSSSAVPDNNHLCWLHLSDCHLAGQSCVSISTSLRAQILSLHSLHFSGGGSPRHDHSKLHVYSVHFCASRMALPVIAKERNVQYERIPVDIKSR